MNNDFVGLQIGGRYGWAESGAISDDMYSLITGYNNAHTKLVFGVQSIRQDPVWARQREWAGPSYGVAIGAVFDGNVGSAGQLYQLTGVGSPSSPTLVPPNPAPVNGANGGVATATSVALSSGGLIPLPNNGIYVPTNFPQIYYSMMSLTKT